MVGWLVGWLMWYHTGGSCLHYYVTILDSNFCLVQALVEILLLSGGTVGANFQHLAHAWGRERTFHHELVAQVCRRRGDCTRKKREASSSTTGKTSTTSKLPRQDGEVADVGVGVGVDTIDQEPPHVTGV